MAANQEKLGTIVNETPDRTMGQIPTPEEKAAGDSGEVKNTLGFAYQTYLEGRRNLALAFKERGQHDQEAYRAAEERFQLCKEAIDRAMKVRERAELYASDVYREDVAKAFDLASRVYQDRTKQVLTECKQKVMEAWKSSTENSAPMTSFCEEAIEKAMKAREKAELDALDAYKVDVDKAVDKASRVYKDNMKQALTDCMQKVMNTWVTSMDTSMQMTGTFIEDRNIKEKAQYSERTLALYRLQIRGTIVHIQRKLISISLRVSKKLKLRRYA
jgi:hypothetical protein